MKNIQIILWEVGGGGEFWETQIIKKEQAQNIKMLKDNRTEKD